jgi:hypothetical protein
MKFAEIQRRETAQEGKYKRSVDRRRFFVAFAVSAHVNVYNVMCAEWNDAPFAASRSGRIR